MSVENLITEHLDIWTSAIKTKSAAGRGSSKKLELVGVKKLRELILELAVRGKLVPQDPNDEPASELLTRIEAEKAFLLKEGKIKKQKVLPEIVGDELPCELPNSWMWARLGNITNYGHCDKIEAKDASPDTWVLELEDVEKETSKLLQKKRFFEREFKSSKNVFIKGDVIYGKLRPYLDKVLVADESGVCTTEMIPVRAYKEMLPEFLRLSMKSPNFKEYANNSTHGMNLPRMGTDKAKLALIPTCSLQEQHRIVAKVDELMALCDQLEAQTEASIDAHKTLVEVLLATLTDAKNADELNDNWQTISQHFDVLFTTQASIDQLKQTILQLAVMGKLVKQDPKDEPASKLLERIVTEKQQLIKDGKIKKQKPLPPITADEKTFELPEGWEWSRIVDASLFTEYGTSEKAFEGAVGVPVLKMGDIQSGKVFHGGQKVVPSTINDLPNLYLEYGDVLYNRTNSAELVGKTGMFEGETGCYTFASYLIRIRCHFQRVIPQYLTLSMNTPLFRRTQIDPYVKQQCGQANVNGTLMKSMIITIPPLLEQRRIVAKIDELLALCDSLKANVNQAKTTQLHLTDVLVEQAL
jgi:type I restriction enzyme S subunit